MIKKIKHLFLALSIATISSCSYLDIVPDMIATIEDNAFSMRSQAEKFLFTCYFYMPVIGHQTSDPAMLGGDEIWLADHNSNYNNPKYIAKGEQRSNEPYLDFWRGTAGGKPLYRGISDCNIFLENIDRVPDIETAERNRWRAEVEILKAYFHFYLIRMYGPIPIKDVNLTIQDDTEVTHVYRNTLDECFGYVVNKIDSIIKLGHLPDVIQDKAQEEGRITEAIARILKAKVLVYWASPLFNGNTDYRGLKDNREIEIFCPVKTEEQKRQRWVEAATACREAVEFLEARGLTRLYRYTGNNWPNISETTRTRLTIRQSLTEKWNDDILWAGTTNWGTEIQRQSLSRDLDQTKASSNTEQRANFAVPVKILHQFYTKNGVPIDEDKTWNYTGRFTPRLIEGDQRYNLAVGETTAGIHFDREPRYYASIGFDRGIWFGQGNTSETDQYLKCRNGETAANQVMHSWNATGMFPKKLVHPGTSLGASSGITFTSYPFPFIRLPEVYLMYAEALNEADDSQAARDLAIQYIDSVRFRAGLQGVKESWREYSNDGDKPNRQQGLRDIVRQETLIEFVFEGHRFWDLRRWKTALTEYNKPVTGWNLKYQAPLEYYNETLIYQAKFTPRDYFWPVHDGEILRNSNTLQNYGW
jgi:hypothetical protein